MTRAQGLQVAVMVGVPPGGSIAYHALRFCESLLSMGGGVPLVFFYGDGVYQALAQASPPEDEWQALRHWQALAQRGVELGVCSAAAERRGVLTSCLAEGFVWMGLASWVAASAGADRRLLFREPR